MSKAKTAQTASFDPAPTRYPFPLDTAKHYLIVKKDNGLVFDKDYPYIDRSRAMRFKQFWVRALLYVFVFPLARVRLGLKIKGRKKLKENAKLLKNGFISCCNHVHLWDYICVMRALSPRRLNLLAWDKNIRGENGTLIRLVGGIPIPQKDPHALAALGKALKELFERHGALHVYGEGSMWEFYRPVRPFRTGFAYLACKYGVPVQPMAFSYRRPGFIRRVIFRQQALFTLNIGDPIFPDTSLGLIERRFDLTRRCHASVCRLAGFAEGENIYPPVYEDSRRIDYYTPGENWERSESKTC